MIEKVTILNVKQITVSTSSVPNRLMASFPPRRTIVDNTTRVVRVAAVAKVLAALFSLGSSQTLACTLKTTAESYMC